MTPDTVPQILFANMDVPDSHRFKTYRERGGYRALEKTLKETSPDDLRDLVKTAGIRGRGGAGFPAGVKWGFVPQNTGKPIYLCVNADESEPGTFKDRVIMEKDPHMLIEGIALCSYAINCHQAYIYIRGEFHEQARILQTALDEAREAGFVGKGIAGSPFDLEITIHRGAGAYICGEETSLMESIEGKRGWPRTKPPFPAVIGLFGCPTVINNVETLASLPWIVTHGAEAYRKIGTEKSTGTKLFCLSGHIKRPGVVELPLGTSFREIIYEYGGGIPEDRNLKGVIPGGVSAPVLTADQIDISADFESLMKAGSMLGSGGLIVMDETVCMVSASLNIIRFFAHESCGQCTPCREGCAWLALIIDRMEHGQGKEGDIDLILDICHNMKGRTICPFGDAAAMPIEAMATKFREEFEEHIGADSCPVAKRVRAAGMTPAFALRGEARGSKTTGETEPRLDAQAHH